MASIFDIQKKSNQYVANLDANFVRVIEGNKKNIIETNQDQFLKHKDADGNPLIHKNTGSTMLSKQYAKRTGKKKPDFFENGNFFDKMILVVPNVNEYFVQSKSFVSKYLGINYGGIFGIMPKNQPKTQQQNDKLILNDYMNKVFR